jgi:hypothetical protein
VTVAAAGNVSGPYYVAIWSLTADGDPDVLHGYTQVSETSVTDLDVPLDVEIDGDGQIAAVLHPDADGEVTTADDPVVSDALTIDVANVTVTNATATAAT